MNTDALVMNLVQRWQELHREGRAVTVEELCADCPELAEAVARQLSALAPTGSILTVPEVAPATPYIPTTVPPALLLPEHAGRFRLLGEIARGGMGAVLRAHDPAIGRDVAIKVVLPQYNQDAGVLRRFFAEVRLAGQLLHPGVAPVYDLGHLPDGRPFFAMKLIEGRTLADLLRQQKKADRDWPRFLKLFEGVCQTIGYAHSRGVLHRDLKPSNIMVGAFGEVQVMDWGLAKVLHETTGVPDETPLCLEGLTEEGAESQVGAIVGTPGYMAPEQVRREVEGLDARCDVFGLGAILCEIMTGAPPFRGTGLKDLLLRTERGDLAEAFARLDGSGADAELVVLARACLAPRRDDRPADGNAVAAAVAAYLSGVQERLRQAELARARTEEERHRRRTQLVQAHYSLAGTLHRQGRLKEAEAAYRETICLQADYPLAHYSLGVTLSAQGRFKEAANAYREAIRLKPDAALAHINLSKTLRQLNRPHDAEASSQAALQLEPHNPMAHCSLGAALQDQGRFVEGLAAFRRGHELGSKLSGWREPSAQWVRDAERLVELDRLLAAVLRGLAEPASAVERLELAFHCQHPARRLHAAAVRLAADAFAAEPRLADDLGSQARYNAACSAVLAAGRQAEDARDLSDTVAAELRQQALQWLQADLALYAQLAGRKQLTHWQTDADLAGVRDKEGLTRLPEAESAAWNRLWADVSALSQRPPIRS